MPRTLSRATRARGIAAGIGSGQGDWRLVLDTVLDIEPLAYVETSAGFVDRIHDLVPPTWFYHRVALTGPDSGGQHDGRLRLITATDAGAQVVIFGLDEEGNTVPGQVYLSMPAGSSRTVSATELENGAPGLTGQLGAGGADAESGNDGDWQLLVFSDPAVEVMTLLDSVSGPLSNLSVAIARDGDIPLFPSAADALREGSLHITNRSGAMGVRIHAVDDGGTAYGPVALAVAPEATVQLTSGDLENGNAEKGLPVGLGSGQGDWRLKLESDLELDVLAYARIQNGFITAVHDVAAEGERRHHVPWFNPASETMQSSRLRLINPTDGEAEITIQAWDDAGEAAPDGAVRLTLPAGASESISAQELEDGAEGLTGNLGDGGGKWRLSIQADRPIRVMSLIESSEGHLTNVSTAAALPRFLGSCLGGPVDGDGDGVSDHCDREPDTALRPLSGCDDGTYVQQTAGNFGLVGDCRVLIAFANVQAQGDDLPEDHALRQWGIGEMALIGTWDGIVVSGGRITEIRMAGTSEQPGVLTGRIPPELGDLTELTVLDLSHNQLTGPIPDQLGNLSRLTDLRLHANQLSGTIPAEIGQLVELIHLHLYDNELSGRIPAELGKLSKLTILYLHLNQLSGTIPAELGQLSNVTRMYLSDNELTGTIPAELGSLINLTRLYLFNNALSGLVPAELGKLVGLRDLRLYANGLSGRIPNEFGQLVNLVVLHINENSLNGPIPPELGQLSNLTYLIAHQNQLSGSIPAELGSLVNLTHLYLSDNALSGTIPEELGNLSRLTDLRLNSNRLSGPIPEELGQLVNLWLLSLRGNELTGAIPAELGKLINLTQLYLSDNAFSGPIPGQLGNLAKLTDLRLSTNRLSGPIPSELGQLTNLTQLILRDNRLSGAIPSALGGLRSLVNLNLAGNQLSGSIPSELADLTKLSRLRLSINRLTGTVPWAFWERVARGELLLEIGVNLISGFEPPPQRTSRPVFSTDPADNGNASHHSVAYYQGPLVWEWNWQDESVEHQQPILGRWAALAVSIDHEVAEPPLVITRVLDSDDEVLTERLTEAAPPSTVSTGSGQWRTEYVFELPGMLYQAGNQLVHVIDPDGEMAETAEDDNVGETIVLYGETPPKFKVTFIPVRFPGTEALSVDAAILMTGVRAFWPIADDFEARLGSPLETNAVDSHALLGEVLALWNAQADPDEFYHGVFERPRPASGDRKHIGGGRAYRPGYAGISQIGMHNVIPHEFGHNLSLGHAPGCGAGYVDDNYPYPNGALGPNPGWDVNWRRFVSNEDGYADIMSSCSDLDFPSYYHYRKATDYWLDTRSGTGDFVEIGGGVSTMSPVVATQSTATAGQAIVASGEAGGLALSGRIDAAGVWSLTHALSTEKGARPPAADGELTLVLVGEGGVELYREPLAVMTQSVGDEGGWAARTPRPASPVSEVVILNATGVEVLREPLPSME